MKFCSQCGEELADGAKFCNGCGNPVTVEQPGEAPTSYRDPATQPNFAPQTPNQVGPATTAGPVVPPQVGPVTTADPGFAPKFDPVTGEPVSATPIPAAAAPPKKKKTWLFVLAGVVVLLLVGAFAFYSMGNFSGPKTPKLAAADTELLMVVKPNYFQAGNFEKLKETYLAVPEVKKAYDQLLKDLKDNDNFVYERDVEPWLGGEVALIMPSTSKSEKMVFAAEQTSKAKAQEFIKKMSEKRKTKEETYNGVSITADDSDFAAAVSGDYLLMATDKTLLKQIIDRQQGKLKDSISDNKEYNDLIGKLPGGSAFCYINLAGAVKTAAKEEAQVKAWTDQLQVYQRMAWSVSFENNGIRSDYLVACDKGKIPAYYKKRSTAGAEVKATLALLPPDCLGFVRSSSLVDILQESYNSTAKGSQQNEFNEGLKSFEQSTGVNVKQDIFGICRGDAAVAVMPKNGFFFGDSGAPVSGVLILGIKDQQQATSSLDKITKAMTGAQVAVNKNTVNGYQMYEVKEQNGLTSFSFGLGKTELIMGSSPEISNAIVNKHAALGDDATYKKAFTGFSSDAEPFLYVNVPKVTALIESNLSGSDKSDYKENIYPWTIPVKTLSLVDAGYNESQGTLKGSAFISIQK
ncbi:MAG: DUF3352 domain-containing protein [Syntrophomonas sp.]